MNCLGCRLINKEAPVLVVYEDDYVSCILDHLPFNEGHVLILPKKHARFLYDLDEKTGISLLKAASLVSKAIKQVFQPDGITVIQNGGDFDELTHFHMHIVPRYKGQNFAEFYIEDECEQIVDATKLKATQKVLMEAILELKFFY